MPLTTHPLRVKKMFTYLSLLEKEIGETDCRCRFCQVSLSPCCYPEEMFEFILSDRNTNRPDQHRGTFALADRLTNSVTDFETFTNPSQCVSQRSPALNDKLPLLLQMHFTSMPNLQCIRGYLQAPRQRVPAWECQSAFSPYVIKDK